MTQIFLFKKITFFIETLWWLVINRKKMCLVLRYYLDFFWQKQNLFWGYAECKLMWFNYIKISVFFILFQPCIQIVLINWQMCVFFSDFFLLQIFPFFLFIFFFFDNSVKLFWFTPLCLKITLTLLLLTVKFYTRLDLSLSWQYLRNSFLFIFSIKNRFDMGPTRQIGRAKSF